MNFQSLKDHVYDYISDEIKNKNLKSNDKINEQAISDKLNISRTPVREALIQLSADGLLESSPRRGFRVKPLTEKEARDLYSILATLDSMAASLSVDNLTDEDFSTMEELISEMYVSIDKNNFSQYFKLQQEFHNTYILKSLNAPLIEVIFKLRKRFLRQGYEDIESQELKKILHLSNKEHETILNLLRKKEKSELNILLLEQHWNLNYSDINLFP